MDEDRNETRLAMSCSLLNLRDGHMAGYGNNFVYFSVFIACESCLQPLRDCMGQSFQTIFCATPKILESFPKD